MFYFEDAELFDEQLICHGVSNPPHCFDRLFIASIQILTCRICAYRSAYLLVEPATINGRFCVPSYADYRGKTVCRSALRAFHPNTSGTSVAS